MSVWNWAIGREITVKQILPEVCRAWVILGNGVEYHANGIDPIDAVGKLKWAIESEAAKNAKRVKIRGDK